MDPVKEISTQEIKTLIQEGNPIVVDIRDEQSFNEGHIEGSVHLENLKLPLFIQNTPKDQTIIVVCYHGNSSKGVTHYLGLQGFKNAYSLMGGYEEWAYSND